MKKLIASILIVLNIIGFTAYGANGVPILLYHNVEEEYDISKSIVTITPKKLEEHITYLMKKGYNPITFDQYFEATKGKYELPENPFIITFDDGYLSNYTLAYPVLQKLNVPATIFVVTSTVGKTPSDLPHFDWEQAREMAESGLVSIQSHTNDHVELDSLFTYEVLRQLRYSKYLIEKNLGTKCNVISYPYGYHNSSTINMSHLAGYDMAVQVGNAGMNTLEDVNKALVRITVYGSWSPADVLYNMEAYAR